MFYFREICLFTLLDILHRPSGGYMNVVHISELIKLLRLGIWDLTSQSPFRKISLGINICLDVLRRQHAEAKIAPIQTNLNGL